MASVQDCTFIEATICPGYVGTASIWLNKSLIAGRSMATGGAFSYDGICYSVPANPQAATPPSGASYANSIGNLSAGCPECCAFTVNPPVICVRPGDSGPVTFTVTGKPGSPYTLVWSSGVISSIADNGTPITSPYNATISAGGTDTVSVTVSKTAPVGSYADIAVEGCSAQSVSVGVGGSTCEGPQPLYLVLSGGNMVGAEFIGQVMGACDGAPSECVCTKSNMVLKNVYPRVPCGNLPFIGVDNSGVYNVAGIAIAAGRVSIQNPWEIQINGCCYGGVTNTFGLVKPCGTDPVGRYYYQDPRGFVDYSHYIDVTTP